MRIQRDHSRLSFRTRRQRNGFRSGCLSLAVLLGIVVGVGAVSWSWIEQFLVIRGTPQTSADLRTAQQAFDRGDLDSAIDAARQVWAAQPDRSDALVLLVRALIYRSYADYDRDIDRDIALQFSSGALTRHPEDPDILAAHAFALQAVGQANDAARTAETVLRSQPDHVLARVALALAYARAGGYDAALRETLQAVQGTNWQLDAQRALAISYADLGRYRDAVSALNQAIALNGHLLVLHFERAQYFRQLGDSDSATAAYFRVLAFDADNVKVRLRLCELSSTLRERDAAIGYCREVTERAPNWPDGWYRLGREYFLQGNFIAAQTNLNRCSSLQVMQNVPVDQRRFECWYLQGQAAEILGDCEGLLTTYNEFREMTASAALPQTWTYPPEGPAVCAAHAPGN